MSNWGKPVLTKQGLKLQAKVDAGSRMQLTQCKIGSGTLSSGQNLEDLTALIAPVQTLPIASINYSENTSACVIAAVTDNSNVTSGYYLREFGWGEHAAQARRYGGEKYRKMLSAARKYLSDVAKYGQPNGGVSLWVELPVGVGAEALCSRMLEKNVILTPGSQYDISGEENRHIRLSFLNLSDDKIEVGLKRIGDMIRAMLEEKFLTLP